MAPRLDKKKVPVSLLIMPRLNLMSLHSRPPAPTITTSTPQTSTQHTSIPQTSTQSTQLRKPQLNQLNSPLQPHLNQPQLNSANLDSTNLHLLTTSLDSTSDSRLRCLDTQLFVGLLWHTATTTRSSASLTSFSLEPLISTHSSTIPISNFHRNLDPLQSFFRPTTATLRLKFPDNFTHNPLAPTNFFSKGRAL